MLTVALCVLFAANVSLVILLAAMWTARSPRHPQHADFQELAGVLWPALLHCCTAPGAPRFVRACVKKAAHGSLWPCLRMQGS